MKLLSIASGSSGNCIYVGEENKGILFDTGISMKRIRESLENNNLSFEQIKGICITHEHSDHVGGLGPILRKYAIPVYGTEETLQYLIQSGKMKNVDLDLFFSVKADVSFAISGMEVTPFTISHDAVNPVCYTIEAQGKKAAVATDMGTYSDYTKSHLKDSQALLLEANHDINMLQVGKYPYSLKLRVLGNYGHLSNDTSARLIKEIVHDRLQHVILGHLSEENNYPELAYKTVQYELEQDEKWNDISADITVAKRHSATAAVTI